uniref:Dynamin N-terminal domain-containing protein n=1 Tax=Trichuris muris TaxID=70415 RepID=A0A5S6Q9G4_TRIMR
MRGHGILAKKAADGKNTGTGTVLSFSAALRLFYVSKVLPSEQLLPERLLGEQALIESEFSCPPCVLLVGDYSVGKTTMLRHLLKTDYAGARIGEGPTTDAFSILMYGEEHRQFSVASMINDEQFPYQGLQCFDYATLKRCFVVLMPSMLLRHVTLVDSPGILPKSEPQRDYDYESVICYFASRADSVWLLYDARKPFVSEQLAKIMSKFQPFQSKLTHIINKVDSCNAGELNHAFNNILTSLARIYPANEVPHIYVGSFWTKPMRNPVNYEILERDMRLLYRHLRYLTFTVHIRRLDEVTRHASRIRATALAAKESQHLKLLFRLNILKRPSLKKRLDKIIYPLIVKKYYVNPSDLPTSRSMTHCLCRRFQSGKPLYTPSALNLLEDFLKNDVHRFLDILSSCMSLYMYQPEPKPPKPQTSLFTWQQVAETASRCRWREVFKRLSPSQDKLDVKQVMPHIERGNISKAMLERAWRLSCRRQLQSRPAQFRKCSPKI